MTDKKHEVIADGYTELAIQIATLDMKLNKILELLNNPATTIEAPKITINAGHANLAEIVNKWANQNNNNPLMWPHESHTHYLKRIGQYNEANSDNEKFTEDFK